MFTMLYMCVCVCVCVRVFLVALPECCISAYLPVRGVSSLIRENSASVCLVINSTSQHNVFPLAA